jgi:TolB-like protein/class 3 adenylate cyclase
MTETRKIAAILVADVVGYSRLVGADEDRTLARLRALRSDLIDPTIAVHHGRVVKRTGDGAIVEFRSVIDAVRCALELQDGMVERNAGLPPERRIECRIGIHLGDVVEEGDGDLMGDAVNIAARLEGICEVGGICISEDAYRQVRDKIKEQFVDLGEQTLKNIARPVRAYQVISHRSLLKTEPIPPEPASIRLALPDKPSIAVLPFTNMSTDPEHETFADGLTEDLITDLSRSADLFVIARNSTFAYKGRAVDVRQIARELGVRYLLEGSARRAAGRVRINVQLIDASAGGHVWAERFDRGLEDVFAVQDEVTGKIVEALIGRLRLPPPRNKPTSMEAYDLCVRARLLIANAPGSPEAIRESFVLLEQAIAIDPGYAEAHRWCAFALWSKWALLVEPIEPNRRLSVEFAEKAVTLDPNDAGSRWILGHVLAYEHRWAESETELAKALELDPNNADALAIGAEFMATGGSPLAAIEQVQKALRLNPHPPAWYYWELGLAQYAARQYESAVETLREEATYRTASRRILAASLAQLGRSDEARREATLFMASNPHFTVSYWAQLQPWRDAATLAHFVEGYRKAGLPH